MTLHYIHYITGSAAVDEARRLAAAQPRCLRGSDETLRAPLAAPRAVAGLELWVGSGMVGACTCHNAHVRGRVGSRPCPLHPNLGTPPYLPRPAARSQPSGSFHDRSYVPAHYVVVDPTLRAVVLVVRGSLGLRDVFVDLHTAPPDPNLEEALGRGCHGGIAAAAAKLVSMHRGRLLAALAERPGWRLVLTGHSLGGGVASFAARLLRCETSAR